MSTSRLRAALAAGTAAIATVAVLAASGSAAQAPPTTLHTVSTPQKHVGFFPKGIPHEGSRFGFGARVSGDDTGVDRGVCTVIGKRALCTIQVQLSRGTLSAQGMLPQRAHGTPIAITGGTGAYDGARGTARVTDKKSTTDVVITLLP